MPEQNHAGNNTDPSVISEQDSAGTLSADLCSARGGGCCAPYLERGALRLVVGDVVGADDSERHPVERADDALAAAQVARRHDLEAHRRVDARVLLPVSERHLAVGMAGDAVADHRLQRGGA